MVDDEKMNPGLKELAGPPSGQREKNASSAYDCTPLRRGRDALAVRTTSKRPGGFVDPISSRISGLRLCAEVLGPVRGGTLMSAAGVHNPRG